MDQSTFTTHASLLKVKCVFYKMCFCSFIGKYAGMWTASNQWLEFVGGTISVRPMVDWGGGGVKCLKLWLNYFFLEFGEYFLFSVMNVHAKFRHTDLF